jgi:hypothetical protein
MCACGYLGESTECDNVYLLEGVAGQHHTLLLTYVGVIAAK